MTPLEFLKDLLRLESTQLGLYWVSDSEHGQQSSRL